MTFRVEWAEVLPAAREAFDIWMGQPDLRWARRAWGHLAAAGLTTGNTPLDRLRAYIRVLVIASLYRDFCAVMWREYYDDEASLWLSHFEVNSVHLGQAVGPHVVLEDDDDDAVEGAITVLMDRERPAVVLALRAAFGGVDGFFTSLWYSSVDETDATSPHEPDGDGTAGLEWVHDGCPFLGPTRCPYESDNALR